MVELVEEAVAVELEFCDGDGWMDGCVGRLARVGVGGGGLGRMYLVGLLIGCSLGDPHW